MWPSIQVDYADLSRPLTYADLVGVYALWPTSSAIPQGVAELLGAARSLFTLAWFRYELFVVAVTWSLLAVEAALRQRLGSPAPLLRRARESGLVADSPRQRAAAEQ